MIAPKLALMSLGVGALAAPVVNEARDDGPYNVVGLTLLSLVPAYTAGAAPQASPAVSIAPGGSDPGVVSPGGGGTAGGSPSISDAGGSNAPEGNTPGGVPGSSAGIQPTPTLVTAGNGSTGGTGVGIISVMPVGTSSSTSVFVPGVVSVEPVAGSTTAVFIPTAEPQPLQTQSSMLQPLPSQSQAPQPSQPAPSQSQQPGEPQPQPGASSQQPGQPGPASQSGSQPTQPAQSSQPAQVSSQSPQPAVSQPQPGQPQPSEGASSAPGQPVPAASSSPFQPGSPSSPVAASATSTSIVFSVEPVDGSSSSILIPVTTVPVPQSSQPAISEASTPVVSSSAIESSSGVSSTSVAEQSSSADSQPGQASSSGEQSSEPATTLSSQAADTSSPSSSSAAAAAISSFTPATDQPMPTPVLTLATGDDGSVSTSLLSVAVPLPSALPSVPLSSAASSPPASSEVITTTAVLTTDGSTITNVITTTAVAAASSEPVTSTFVTVISSDDFTTTATVTSIQTPSSTAAATTTLPAVVSRPKRGLVYNDASLAQPFLSSGAITWAYNWYSSSGGLDASIQYVPMMWGTGSDASLVRAAVNPALAHSSPYLLTYNEPDETSQYGGSATTPQAAAAAWAAQIAPLASSFPALQIGSPAVTSYNTSTNGPLGASGLSWLREFVTALPNATGDPTAADDISFVALHWYGASQASGADQAAGFQGYVEAASADVNRIFGRAVPLWITEFSPLPIGDQTVASEFLEQALPWLDAFGPVQRYSFFMDAVGELVDANKALTDCGRVYIS